MHYPITAFPVIALLASVISSAVAHPLNLLHSHHAHHSHHHLHLRLPNFGTRAASRTQQPIGNNLPTAPIDISNVFVNITLTTHESSKPIYLLVPLHHSERASSVKPTPSVYHHPRTAKISNIRYGTSMEDSSRQFERAGDVTCYAHAAPIYDHKTLKRRARPHPFRQRDGETDLAAIEVKGPLSSFTCLLES